MTPLQRTHDQIAQACEPLNERIAQLERELAELRAATAWRPISEAPENVSVLIYIPRCEHYGDGIYRGLLVNMGTGRRWTCNALHMGTDIQSDYLPTHFMPLPKPPTL